MKNSLLKAAKMLRYVMIAAFLSLSLASCEKEDPCEQNCVNGYCSDGDCICNTDYSGKWCATYVGYSGGGSSSSGSSSGYGSSSGGSSSGYGSSSSGGSSSGYGSSSGSSSSGSSSGSSSSGGSSTYTLTFWSDFHGSPINVYISGSYAGTITEIYSSAPSCGASGCVTQTYSAPTSVSYTAEDGDYTWNGTATVSGACNRMNLTR